MGTGIRCNECGLELEEVTGMFNWESILVGTIRIPDIEYLQCPKKKCNFKLLSGEACKAIEAVYLAKEADAISRIPIHLFVTTRDAAAILGMTPTEFRRLQRVRNGFIISHKAGDIVLWLQESVMHFKETKDGRFNINHLALRMRKAL